VRGDPLSWGWTRSKPLLTIKNSLLGSIVQGHGLEIKNKVHRLRVFENMSIKRMFGCRGMK
jgi:hypothetical protein